MGTSIRIRVWKGKHMSLQEWDEFLDDFWDVYECCDGDTEADEFMVEAPVVYCSYKSANLEVQMEVFKKKWKGKGLEWDLWYLENDPDQTEIL